MKIKYTAAKAITPVRIIEDAEVCAENGVIVGVGRRDRSTDAQYVLRDFGEYLAPGYIDIHTHGGGGFDFCDGTEEAFLGAGEIHRKNGTTTLLPTSLTCSDETLYGFFDTLRKVKAKKYDSIPEYFGAHLEGPYFSPQFAGAQDPRYLSVPRKEHYMPILEKYGDIITRWSFAPELDGAMEFSRELCRRGILSSAGHSAATVYDMEEALENGCTHLTHHYCAMSGMTKRGAYKYPGVIDSAYIHDEFTTEVIADGHHVPDGYLFTLYKYLGAARVCLVSDSLRVAGLPDGEYYIGKEGSGTKTVKDNGVAFMPDRHAFAGSAVTVDTLVRRMVFNIGVPLADAVRMATMTPAHICGMKRKGVLAVGYDADVIGLDDRLNVIA